MEDYSKSLKWVATVILIESSFCYALLGSSFGSTLIDFKEITNTTMDKMSFSLTFRFAGSCIGAAMSFGIPEKTNTTVLYSFLLTTLGTLSLIIGQLTTLWSVFFVQFLMGVAGGVIDVGCTTQIFQLWSDEGAPFMQTLSFMWNIAGVCSPLLFEPFLSPTRTKKQLQQTNITQSLNLTFSEVENSRNASLPITDTPAGVSRIWIPLSVIGMLLITSGLLVLSTPVYIYMKSKKKENKKKQDIASNEPKTQTPESTENSEKTVVKQSQWKRYRIYLLALCSMVFFVYYALCDTTTQFWLTFVVNCDLKLTKSQAAFMLSALNAAYSVSGLIGIYVSAKIKPFKMIQMLVLLIAAGNIIHVFFANTSLVMLWFGAILVYVGFGCFYATVFNFMQAKVGVTTKMCSILIVWSYLASGLGYTAIIGKNIETFPIILIYNNVGCVMVVAILLFAIYKLNVINKRKNREHKIKLSLRKNSTNSAISK